MSNNLTRPSDGIADETPRERANPLSNAVFTRMFGREDSKCAARALVNAFFRRIGLPEIGEITSIHAEHTDIGDAVGLKEVRFDVFIVAEGALVDMEAERRGANYGERSLLYAARMLASHVKEGADYGDLPYTVVLTLLDAPGAAMPYDDKLVSVAEIRWTGASEAYPPATDRLKFVVANVGKLRRCYTDGDIDCITDEAEAWMLAFAAGFKEDALMDVLKDRFPSLQEFAAMYGVTLQDTEIMERYDAELRSWRETRRYLKSYRQEGLEAGLEEGLKEGLKKGRKEGLKGGRAESVRELYAMGAVAAKDAAEVLGVSVPEFLESCKA